MSDWLIEIYPFFFFFFFFLFDPPALYCIKANILDCDIVVNQYKIQSRYYFQFRTNILGKGMNFIIHSQLWVK